MDGNNPEIAIAGYEVEPLAPVVARVEILGALSAWLKMPFINLSMLSCFQAYRGRSCLLWCCGANYASDFEQLIVALNYNFAVMIRNDMVELLQLDKARNLWVACEKKALNA